ncbi:MAG TPA: hypothetical protein VN258_02430 [Mobilitalea sp.]|nr:hypothetical protein [Mobilitalea sp.]
MNRSDKKHIGNKNERNRLLIFYRRRDLLICLVFLIICLVCPLYKQHLPPIVAMLIKNPKEGLPYATIVLTVDILLYVWIRVDRYKHLQLQNKNLPKGIIKFKRNKSKKEKIQNKWYSVDVATDIEQEDVDLIKPIITIKHYSRLNPSVKKTAIFSKNTSLGCITLSESYTELSDIINECKTSNLPFKVSFDNEMTLTNEELEMVQNIKNLIECRDSV